MRIQHQTSLEFLRNHSPSTSPDLMLFTGFYQAAKLEEMGPPEYSLESGGGASPQADKFVAGWDCFRLDAQGDTYDAQARLSKNENPMKPETCEPPYKYLNLDSQAEQHAKTPTSAGGLFFTASNPADNSETSSKIDDFYKKSVIESSFAGQEIASESVKQSIKTSRRLDTVVNESVLSENQRFCIDPETGKGLPYLHERDRQYKDVLSGGGEINVFLPGYATGDRYTLIFTALVEPRLNISIGYSENDLNQEKAAKEAYDVIVSALKSNGETNPEKRITLLSYNGGSLKGARESLDSPDTKSSFEYIKGAQTSPLMCSEYNASHVFHISVTTEIINRHFLDSTTSNAEKYLNVKSKLRNLVNTSDQQKIDSLVEQLIEFHGIKEGDVALWVADREFANEREAEAISRPKMFDLIAQHLKSQGFGTFNIADTYINRANSTENKEIIVNRHPYRLSGVPHIGRFWAAEIDGNKLLAPRENQWYFMDNLLTKTGGRLIGIRSGALEPFALMGHNVLYLEHKNMFTPERHASWQGTIPYRRIITENTTGYLNLNTEIKRDEVRRGMISLVEGRKLANGIERDPVKGFSSGSRGAVELSRLHSEFDMINDDIDKGVLSQNELNLLTAMLNSEDITSTAVDVLHKNRTV
ncbi:hypothetical protein [Pseudomonas monteilii]|uniref:hypothetical protein n=1 Tax=Pseudomonas monteilii TaxID=76759 RepID=UPI00383AB16C